MRRSRLIPDSTVQVAMRRSRLIPDSTAGYYDKE